MTEDVPFDERDVPFDERDVLFDGRGVRYAVPPQTKLPYLEELTI